MAGKIVGITCSTAAKSADAEARQTLNRAYVWAVEAAGGIPIILPVTRDTGLIGKYLGVVDGLLLSGGVDVEPACYGESPHPKLGETDADRDAAELPLIRAALAQDIPIFAICRGIQTLNIALGGTLYQDLPSEKPSSIHHAQNEQQIPRSQTTHPISIRPDTRLSHIVKADTISVNSLHHQALRDVAEGLAITARAPDGVIEAAEMPEKRYVVAVQYHPEELAPHEEHARRLFESFVEAL